MFADAGCTMFERISPFSTIFLDDTGTWCNYRTYGMGKTFVIKTFIHMYTCTHANIQCVVSGTDAGGG